jgi:hypothetical protein
MLRASFVAIVLALAASPVMAQTAPPLHRIQLGAGIGFLGGAALGDADANLRSSTSNDPYRLFATSSSLAGTTALDLRAGVDLSRRFGLEAHALYGHPEQRTSVSGDAENAPSVVAVERLDHYLIDGGVVITLHEFPLKGWQPFAVAGAGYLRQLHEGLTVTEDGQMFYFGGGARRMFMSRPRGVLRGFGARGDFRVNVLTGGIAVEDATRTQFSASGSLFVVF